MAGKADLLYKLYRDHKRPCFCFDRTLNVIWTNTACMNAFPDLANERSVVDYFPQFPIECIVHQENGPSSVNLANRMDGNDVLEIISFLDQKEEILWVGIYCKISEVKISNKEPDSSSVSFLSYYIRQKMNSIFNLSEMVTERLAEKEDFESAHYMRDIERNCRFLLKMSYNFSAYYHTLTKPKIYPTKVNFREYFSALMDQTEAILEGTDLTFTYIPDYQNGIVEVEKELFAISILNMINISYLYGHEKGHLTCKTEFLSGELLLIMQDDVTNYQTITNPQFSDVMQLDDTGEPSTMKKSCYDILQKTIELHDGQCLISDNDPGIKILIRLPAQLLNDDDCVFDEPNYTSKRKTGSKLGVVDIMLSDVTY
ncbi:MAG: hypothetical protein RR977_00945 [Oscillospiraceae bacterium]